MSTAHDAADAGDAGDAAHDDHAHAFDGEPIQVLPADEPRTPGWLTLLGAALFISAGVAFLVVTDSSPERAAPAKSAAAPPPAPATVGAQPGAGQQVARPVLPTLAPAGQPPAAQPPANRPTPEQVKALQQQINDLVKRGQPAPGQPAPAPPAH